MPEVRPRGRCQAHVRHDSCPTETTATLQRGAQRPVVREQVDAMLPHLPPALRVLDRDQTRRPSWGVSG